MTAKKTTPIRKRRKPMTEEQRAAAAERLKAAREKRAKTNPPTYKNIHPDVLSLPEDHPRSFVKVKQWIKDNREKLPAIRAQVRANQKGAVAEEAMIKGYIAHMETYLKNGDWVTNFYGANMEKRHIRTCVALAYDEDGNPKREKGVFYPDLGFVWGMEDDIS